MSTNDFRENQSEKPEWFSLIEADTRIQHNPRDRGFRIMALAGPLLLISTGLLFAQANGGHDASAIDSSALSAPAKPGTSELASSQPVPPNGVVDEITTEPATAASMGVSSQVSSITADPAQLIIASQSPASPPAPINLGAKSASPEIGQGFVAPPPSTTQSFSDDEGDQSYDSDDDHDHEDESEDSDEGDDD